MSVTSGFYNSYNGDRKYFAEQMSAIFDGIINDGVFANIGTAFGVTAGEGNTVNVGIGFAWFNSKWVRNDAILPLTAEDSEVILDRYDAIVIEVDDSNAVRNGDIKIIKGTPSSEPLYPALAATATLHQYPLCFILRKAGSTEITQANIINAIGTDYCPYITGILQVQSIEKNVAQWEAEWKEWKAQWSAWGMEWTVWFGNEKSEIESQMDEFETEMAEWRSSTKTDFVTWFNSLNAILEGDVAANMAAEILELKEKFHILAVDHVILEDLQDADGDVIEDSYGAAVEGTSAMGSGLTEAGATDDINMNGKRIKNLSAPEAETDAVNKAYVDSKLVETTLQAVKWSGSNAPYRYVLEVDGVTETSNQEILPAVGISVERYLAFQSACVLDGGQEKDKITLLSYGTKPTLDIPIRIILRGNC